MIIVKIIISISTIIIIIIIIIINIIIIIIVIEIVHGVQTQHKINTVNIKIYRFPTSIKHRLKTLDSIPDPTQPIPKKLPIYADPQDPPRPRLCGHGPTANAWPPIY